MCKLINFTEKYRLWTSLSDIPVCRVQNFSEISTEFYEIR